MQNEGKESKQQRRWRACQISFVNDAQRHAKRRKTMQKQRALRGDAKVTALGKKNNRSKKGRGKLALEVSRSRTSWHLHHLCEVSISFRLQADLLLARGDIQSSCTRGGMGSQTVWQVHNVDQSGCINAHICIKEVNNGRSGMLRGLGNWNAGEE